MFLDVTVHEASDVNSGQETMIAGILGALLGCVVLLCVSNLAIALCICSKRRSRKASAGPQAAPSKSPAAPKPSKAAEKLEEKKSFSFGMRSKSTDKDEEKLAVAKKGWFGRKKHQEEQLADEEAPAAPEHAPPEAAEADGFMAASHGTPEPENEGGNATSP